MCGLELYYLILDDWQRVFQKEEERVVDFKVRVCTYLRALGIDMVRKPEDQKRIIAELEPCKICRRVQELVRVGR